MKRHWLICGSLATALLMSCGGSKETAESTNKEEAKPAAAVIDQANAATVTGKVAFTGDKPTMRALDMSANPACARMHGDAVKSEEVVVNDNGTLQNVFVWVKAGVPDQQWPTPSTPVELDQKGCMYTPHMIAVMTNQPVNIKNTDPTNHNVHPMPKINQDWNQSQPPKGDALTKTFPREEIGIPVKCNVHPWMRAYINVVSHPFFAVTGNDGTFTIKGLPPGNYTIETWHEKYGTQDMQVTVAPKETKTVDFTYKG